MKDEIGQRQMKEARSLSADTATGTRLEAGRLIYWLQRIPLAAWCATTGRHRWADWRPTSTPFVPPESRYCRRCGGTEYRGDLPAFKITFGACTPDDLIRP